MTGPRTTHALHTVGRILAGQPAGGISDRELLRRFTAARDEGAFAALVHRHGPMVLATCRRVLHNAHDAEDAFQAAFLTLARKAPAPGWQDSVAAWLHLIAYRLALKVRADAERRTAAEPPPPARPSSDALAEVSGRELCAILDEELSALPHSYRAPLVLCCLEGLSRDEAAQRLGWSQGSVKGRLERGRELLRRRLERRGVALSAGLAGLALAGGARAALAPGLRAAAVAAALGRGVGASARVAALAAALRGGTGRGKPVAGLLLALVAAGAGLGLFGRRPAPEPERPQQPVEARPAEKGGPGDPLPAGAVSRLGTVRFRHASTIYSITFAPDGKVIATGSLDNTVRLWDAATGKELARLGRQNGAKTIAQVITVAFSPDGKAVGSGSNDGTIRLYDAKTGKVRHEIAGGQGYVAAMAFAPDGKSFATAHWEGKSVVVWDAATGKELRRLTGHSELLSALAYSADGKVIVTGSADHSVRAWDAGTGRQLRRFDAGAFVEDVAVSPDGNLVVAAARETGLPLWDLATGEPAGKLPVSAESHGAVAFSPDGKTLAAATATFGPRGGEVRGRVVLFDVAARKELRQLTEGDHYPIKSLAFSPDGQAVAAAGWINGSLRLWDAATGKERLAGGHNAQITAAVFTPDGRRVVTSAWDETARVWDAATGKELARLPGGSVYMRPDHRPLPGSVAHLRPGGKELLTVSGLKEQAARLWDVETGKELRKVALPRWEVRQAIDPGGTTLARPDADGSIGLYDLATGKERGRLAGHKGIVWLTFSADGRRLASAGADQVVVWDAVAARPVRKFSAGDLRTTDEFFIYSVVLSPDGALLAARCDDGQVRAWDTTTGEERMHLRPGEEDAWGDLHFSPDGRTLLAGGQGGQVVFWEVATGKERRRLEGQQGSVDVVAFSADGRFLVTGGSESAALVWDLRPRGKPLTADDLKAAWDDLASDDAATGYRAVWQLAAAPAQGVPFLQEALPVAQADEKRIAKLIADLDSDEFETREQAATGLEKFGELAGPALRKTLAGRPSAEVRARCEGLLVKLDRPTASGERLRTPRAVEALELADTKEARDLLRRLADGAEGARLTREAKAALHRLAR
jgi:RNA polymerase sigma factor (sigma-70 family)